MNEFVGFLALEALFLLKRGLKKTRVFENYLVAKTLQKYTGNFSDRIRNKFFKIRILLKYLNASLFIYT
jgi:hypothetical protein